MSEEKNVAQYSETPASPATSKRVKSSICGTEPQQIFVIIKQNQLIRTKPELQTS